MSSSGRACPCRPAPRGGGGTRRAPSRTPTSRWRSTSKRLTARKVSTICGPDRVGEHRVGLQRVERGLQRAWAASAAVARARVVGVAGDRRPAARARRARRAGRRTAPRRSPGTGWRAPSPTRTSIRVRAAALGRDADERRAVVPAPVGVRGRERVGHQAPVGVDRRVQERHQRGGVREHAGREVRAAASQTPSALVGRRRTRCSPSRSSERCRWKPEPPWSLNGLPMNVATRPCWAATSLTARLQPERAVGGVERVGVAQVDLVLAVHELVVGGERARGPSAASSSVHPAHHAARDRPAGRPCRPCSGGRRGARMPPARPGRARSRKNSSSGPTTGAKPSSSSRRRRGAPRRAGRRARRSAVAPARGRPGTRPRRAPTAAA